MVLLTILQILQVLLDVIWVIILVQFILSILLVFNVVSMASHGVRSLVNGLDRLTEPMYRPIRRVIPAVSGLDLAPLVVLVSINILDIIIRNVAVSAAMHGAI